MWKECHHTTKSQLSQTAPHSAQYPPSRTKIPSQKALALPSASPGRTLQPQTTPFFHQDTLTLRTASSPPFNKAARCRQYRLVNSSPLPFHRPRRRSWDWHCVWIPTATQEARGAADARRRGWPKKPRCPGLRMCGREEML